MRLSLLIILLLLARAPHAFSASKQWKLVWSDEFNYKGKPDPTKWDFETGGGGWGNDELENYTDRIENSRVQNGHLIIELRKEDFEAEHYTSARMRSKGPGWTYGKMVVRAKLPRGAGTWPAIWMMPHEATYGDQLWPDNGEMDIMEHVGRDPKQILGCFYTKNFNWTIDTGKTVYTPVHRAESQFHVYSLEWTAEQVSLAVDGKTYNVFKNPHTNWADWPFDKNFFLIMNLALGGFGGDVDETIFPQKLLVDYVRVYQ